MHRLLSVAFFVSYIFENIVNENLKEGAEVVACKTFVFFHVS
jgi:hypothetical protein